ncbi:TPA: phytoene desaturase [Corynebacterium striatum]|uniref:phytoene desaturase family protein n=1 Tax=Corynebacterium striatum TaxID=43770 RepID=UPI003B5B999B|nr:phytoene desaturase [Corynebacterium striatum]HCD1825949.1 phytoene desaturase [Corynebacterium striatum]HCD2182101.1 phytoene desaturase [Corynebacterium striatum]HCD2851768.1 phytoene desaturase [Corynebacterium striatum]HCD3732226.1 phytoene desaturase [Corynebacterium striatum]
MKTFRRGAVAKQPESVIVIGAGVAGLATAALLARDGKQVTVVDKLEEVGGRAGSLSAEGFRWDTGPSWYLMPEAFDHFFELCGTSTAEELSLVDLTPAYRVYDDSGQFINVETGVDKVATLFESIEPGAGQRVRDYLDQATDVYNVALERFLYTAFSDPRELLAPTVRSRLGTLAQLLTRTLDKHVVASFRDYRLRQVLSYPAVFLSSEPSAAPAIYSLMSHTDLVEGVRYPLGGFSAVVEAIARQARNAGVTFLLGTEVTGILTDDSARATGVRIMTSAGSQELLADAVVSAADLHHTETSLLPAHLRSYSAKYFAGRDAGLGTVLVLLGVKGELPQLAHHTLLFSKDWEPDFRAVYHGPEPTRVLDASHSIYISKTSATDPAVAPVGHENLFVLVPVPANTALGHGDAYGAHPSARVEAIADAAIAQIGRWAGIDDFASRIVVRHTLGPADFAERYHAWRGGSIGPAHTLAQSAFFRGKNVSSKVESLYYAGATTVPGVGVPMCLISAENILKRMHGDTTAAPLMPLH